MCNDHFLPIKNYRIANPFRPIKVDAILKFLALKDFCEKIICINNDKTRGSNS